MSSKIRMFKQVVEVGHSACYGGPTVWVADAIIDDAEKVVEYLAEAKKDSTFFGRGVYSSPTLGDFVIRYYFVGEIDSP